MKTGRRRPEGAGGPNSVTLIPAHIGHLLRAYRGAPVVVPPDPRAGSRGSNRKIEARVSGDVQHLQRSSLISGEVEPYALTAAGAYWLARGLRPLVYAMSLAPASERPRHKAAGWRITPDEVLALRIAPDYLCPTCEASGACPACAGWGTDFAGDGMRCRDCDGSALCRECDGEGASRG